MKHRPHGLSRSDLVAWIGEQLIPNGECLEWPRGANSKGYGRIRVGGRIVKVHRLVCENAHGSSPVGSPHAIHSCDNPRCANPAHLRWGSNADNQGEKAARGRSAVGAGNGASKLTAGAVRWARKLSAQGCPFSKLAQCYGVTAEAISAAVKRRTWAHVR